MSNPSHLPNSTPHKLCPPRTPPLTNFAPTNSAPTNSAPTNSAHRPMQRRKTTTTTTTTQGKRNTTPGLRDTCPPRAGRRTAGYLEGAGQGDDEAGDPDADGREEAGAPRARQPRPLIYETRQNRLHLNHLPAASNANARHDAGATWRADAAAAAARTSTRGRPRTRDPRSRGSRESRTVHLY